MNAVRKNINSTTEQWIDIHFGDTSFNGRVVFGRKIGGSINTMGARSLTELRPYIRMIQASSKTTDYYITANTVCGIKRRKDDLFGLQNIVIDVDCHDVEQIHSIPALVQAFIWRSKRDLWETGVIPTPNSIVRTGRGIQLWWAIVPCYGGRGYDPSRYYHDKIKNNMIGHIETLLNEYGEELEGLSVDRGASSNPVGYFRLPYTYNTKAKCFSSLEILHSERYDQRDLIKMDGFETHSKVAHERPQHIPMLESDRFVVQNFESTGVRRVLQLIRLRNLRNNEVGSESRNYFNFSVYNALRMTFDHNQAWARLKAYNSGFKKPMTERELENCISSAKEKGGYKYSNEKLIELLGISPEEQLSIGLFPVSNKYHRKPNASRDEARKALREDRDYKILDMVGKGMSQAETARILGIGKNTVGRVLKRLKDTPPGDGVDTIEAPIIENSSRHHFGSIYVTVGAATRLSTRSVSELVDLGEGGLFELPEVDSS